MNFNCGENNGEKEAKWLCSAVRLPRVLVFEGTLILIELSARESFFYFILEAERAIVWAERGDLLRSIERFQFSSRCRCGDKESQFFSSLFYLDLIMTLS
jgi:hypothetical protein